MFVLQCIWYLVPMGVANLAPILLHDRLRKFAIPIDAVVRRPGFFGPHKTIRGLVVAPPFGLFAFWVQQQLSVLDWAHRLELFDYRSTSLWFGVLAGAGAILGDLVRSAFKRRLHIRPGGRFIPWDQLDYLIGGMLLTLPLYQPPLTVVVTTLITGVLLIAAFSVIGYLTGWKKDVP